MTAGLEFWEAVVFAFLGVFPAAVSCPSGRVKSVPPLISEAMLRAPTVKSAPRGVSPEPIEVCDTLATFGALDPVRECVARQQHFSRELGKQFHRLAKGDRNGKTRISRHFHVNGAPILNSILGQ